jgi:flagellar protein FliS
MSVSNLNYFNTMNSNFRLADPNPYLADQVTAASPVQLVVLLYDGAIRFLRTAYEGFAENDPQQRFEIIHNNLIRAQNILTELNACLDMELGGEVSRQLRDLYDCLLETLRNANLNKDISKDPSSILRIIGMLSEVRDSWSQLANRTQAQHSPALAEAR